MIDETPSFYRLFGLGLQQTGDGSHLDLRKARQCILSLTVAQGASRQSEDVNHCSGRKLTLLDIPGLRQWKRRHLRVRACWVRMLRTRECQHAAECGNICVMWGQTEKHRLDTVD